MSRAATAAPTQILTLLLIDDDPQIERFVRRTFAASAAFGCAASVIAASNPEKGIDILDRQSVDLVILDLCFDPSNMQGVDFLKALGKHTGREAPPVLAITGVAPETVREEAALTGAIDCLCKPFGAAELATAVQRAARAGRLRRGQATVRAGRDALQDSQAPCRPVPGRGPRRGDPEKMHPATLHARPAA